MDLIVVHPRPSLSIGAHRIIRQAKHAPSKRNIHRYHHHRHGPDDEVQRYAQLKVIVEAEVAGHIDHAVGPVAHPHGGSELKGNGCHQLGDGVVHQVGGK